MITSKGNAKIRNLVALRKKASERAQQDVFLVEGIKMFREVPADQLVEVYVSESFLNQEAGREALKMKKREVVTPLSRNTREVQQSEMGADERADSAGVRRTPVFEEVSDEVFQLLSDTKSPQGILAVVRQKHYRFEDLLGKVPLVMVLENLQDPGNLGTIIRTAEGAGVTGILMSRGTADLYNPKVTRSTMGSIFRMPFLYTDQLSVDIQRLKHAGVSVCAAHLQGKNTYDRENYRGGTAFLIGNESKGLSDEISALADVRVKIPMEGKVESLNASVAAAILMYEASRQRRKF